MVSRLEKHGDGQALVLDKTLLDMLHINADTPLQIRVSDGALIVTPLDAQNYQDTAAQPEDQYLTTLAGSYPVSLMREYHALTDKKLRRTLRVEENSRLQEIRNQIAAIDERQMQQDAWEVQAQKLREELALLRAEVEALPDAVPAAR